MFQRPGVWLFLFADSLAITSRCVSAKTIRWKHRLYTFINSRSKNIVCTYDIGPDSFHREELTGRDLLQSSMEDIIHFMHCSSYRLQRSDVSKVELNLFCILGILDLILMAHVILFLLISREDTDFTNVSCLKTIKYSIPKRTGFTCYNQ